jgi:hypothetical protein
MAIKTAGELRALQDKKSKPIKIKVELTINQLSAVALGLETLIFSKLSERPGVLYAGQEALTEVKRLLNLFVVLEPETKKKAQQTLACSACGVAKVSGPGRLCEGCNDPLGAA